LTFHPFLLPKVWGGDRLSRFGKAVKPGDKIGESWEIADLSSTSASGAGGGAFRSIISNGPLAGHTLHDAIQQWGTGLMGSAALTPEGDFPLLVKLLDASENLSVQVHPSRAYAAAHLGANLKTECWYILDAAPGAVIYKGVKPGVTRESFAAHIKDGSVVNDLVAVPAIKGDCHNLPSGTVHALGAGVLVAEVQTPSDTTFRVFDWGRSGRELHIAESLKCIEFGPARPPTHLDEADRWNTLVENEFFVLDEVRLPHAQPYLFPEAGAPHSNTPLVIIVVDGALTIAHEFCGEVELTPGQATVIPAALRKTGWQPRPTHRTRVLAVSLA
jgi:mannose-6-phosphate isomerase